MTLERIRATSRQWAAIETATRMLAAALGYGSGWRSAYYTAVDEDTGEESEGAVFIAQPTGKPLHNRVVHEERDYKLRRGKKWRVGSAVAVPGAAPNPAVLAALSFATIDTRKVALLAAYATDATELPHAFAIARALGVGDNAVSHAWRRLIRRPPATDEVARMYGVARDEFRRHVRIAEAFLIGQLAATSLQVLRVLGQRPQPLRPPALAAVPIDLSKKQKRAYRRPKPAPAPCVVFGPDSPQALDALEVRHRGGFAPCTLIEADPEHNPAFRCAAKKPQAWKTPLARGVIFDNGCSRGEMLSVEKESGVALTDSERRPRETWRPLANIGQFHVERYGFSIPAPIVPRSPYVNRGASKSRYPDPPGAVSPFSTADHGEPPGVTAIESSPLRLWPGSMSAHAQLTEDSPPERKPEFFCPLDS
ncbi:hypothetical protein [Dokdonella soli]